MNLFYYFILLLDKIFSRNKVSILVYHQINDSNSRLSVSPDNFESQLKFLRDNKYNNISFDDLVCFLKGEIKLPAKSFIISFDDGFSDNFSIARPLLKKYGFSAIFFIATKYIGRRSSYCTDGADKSCPMMNKEELKSLSEEGFVLANHFYSHENLINLSDDSVIDEYKRSLDILNEVAPINKANILVCYPRNKKDDRVIELLKSSGVIYGFAGRRGVVAQKDNALDLPRIEVFNGESLLKFRAKMSTYYYFFYRVLKIFKR